MTNPIENFAFSSATPGANVVPRTMPDRLSDIADVLDFGADPTGVADSWPAINEAMSRFEFVLTATGPASSGTIPVVSVPAFIQQQGARISYQGTDLTDPSAMSGALLVPSLTTPTSVTFLSFQVPGPIQAGDQIRMFVIDLGTIFFPPGNYTVLQTIDFFKDQNTAVIFRGVGGLSVITGDFPDYVFRRTNNADPGDNNGTGGGHIIEDLTIINPNANGGGIRIGYSVCAAVRRCTVMANRCVNTASDDTVAGVASLEVSLENLYCSLGSAPSANSIGIATVADGPITNCVMVGFEYGTVCWGGEGAMSYQGCRFELCQTGFGGGINGGLIGSSVGGVSVLGCHFKDCGTAITGNFANSNVLGCVIESTGATVFGATPQYGIGFLSGLTDVSGVNVTGPFAVAGVAIQVGNVIKAYNTMTSVHSNNTGAGVNWQLPVTTGIVGQAMAVNFVAGCNVTPVCALKDLPVSEYVISGTSWSDNTAIFTLTGLPGSLQVGYTFDVTITGAPAGYDGVYKNCLAATFNTIAAYLPISPGGSGGGGDAVLNLVGISPNTNLQIESASWSAGTATVNVFGDAGLSGETNANIQITNVPVSGYNGTFMNVSVTGASQVQFPLAANPGANYNGATFNGTITGTALTVVSGLVGTISIGDNVAWTDSSSFFHIDVIVGGSNPNWVLQSTWPFFPTQAMVATLGAMPQCIGVIRADQTANAQEGDTYNVSNSNTNTWASIPDLSMTSGTTHAKLRFNSSGQFSVMGV